MARVTRPSLEAWGLGLAVLTSHRSTCARRQVGCVLLDQKGRVLATGYNGVPAGHSHCNDGYPCAGADAPSGTRLDECLAIHAEQNAILQCKAPDDVYYACCTTMPCPTCLKMLFNTGCQVLVVKDLYPGTAAEWLRRWEQSGRRLVQLD